jgi:transcriptional regulator with XRE-family HTH domain
MNYKDYIKNNNINIEESDVLFDLSNLVFEARVYAGMSQKELADRMGTKQPSIARVENGEVTPSINFLMKIAKAVNTSLISPKFKFMTENYNQQNLYISYNFVNSSSEIEDGSILKFGKQNSVSDLLINQYL